ncbi:MAG: molybdenum cofactor cytidylyltransferase [Dehalococcoidia bacterium]|nr:molybdenum cofactor cytidylyltransferase [Dehalococcoidia bacterium]
MISAILLAAGESNRMGQPKQLMPFDHSTIVEGAIDNLLNSAVSEIIVVLGYKSEEIRKTIAGKPIKIATNPDYQQGMSTSIITGLKQVDKRARAVLIALGDQPFVDSQTINSLVEAFIANNRGIIIPVYQGRRGNPVIFAIKYKGELLNLKGDVGGREIIKRHPDDVLEVAVNSEGVLLDIDTMENYIPIILNPEKYKR